ncbi:MAG: acyloxyacyl hydrolase [Saprospiraceae bacterium]|nr:acyloxyacyl hydrolase [Saprospiraceae bacterium]
MKRHVLLTFILSIWLSQSLSGQVDNSFGSLPPFTKWYQNPLGVSPIALHTSNGIIIPAIAAGAILIFTKKESLLARRASLYTDIGYTKGYYGSFSGLYHSNIGMNYMLRKYMSAGVEFTQVYINDEVNNVYGCGIRPFFRFYPINKEHFNLYFSSGAGLIYFFDNYPKPSDFFGDMREGTKLNGCPKYGIGTEFKINSRLNISAGLWHIHFSNGDNPSFERNPGHDSNGFSVGLSYKPGK